MLDIILYFIPAFILVAGLSLFVAGKAKKNHTLKGVGIGCVASLVVLESPDFIQGLFEGFANAGTDGQR